MNHQNQVFNHPQFGEICTVQQEEGKVLFKANDVARSLGYAEAAKAVRTHCKGVSVLDTPIENQYGTVVMQPTKFISESDVYRLVMRSKLPEAEKFQDWVCEEVLPDHSGLVYSTRQEGERVGKGRSVATVYHSEAALSDARQLEILEERLEQLQYAQSAASGAQAVLKLDNSIRGGIFALKGSVAQGNLTAASQESGALQTLVLKRDYTYRGTDELEEQITALEAEIRTLRISAQAGSSAITAPRSGYYASVVDGYETVLTPAILEDLTPSKLRAVSPDPGAVSSVGKLIIGNTWYYAAPVSSAAVKDLREGQEVTLRFASGLDRDITMVVHSLCREENGEQVLILESDSFLSITTLLRRQNAQLIFHAYGGIRVPKSALRVVTDTVPGAEGEEDQEVRVTAVYCRVGRMAQLKPVRVVYEGEDYYLVSPDPEALGVNLNAQQLELFSIRSGDEIIVTANNLYNGKVIG